MDQPILRLDAVTKSFGARAAVERLSFEVRRGEIFALLGPNGAGKTTTVRMLVGILRPDDGVISGFGGRTGAEALPPDETGYLPEERGLYREIPVLRTLVYFGMLRGLSKRDARSRAISWLETMGLADRQHERLDALSKGNQQRVQLIAAILHRPAFAILDEPFTGLDPVSQEFFLDLVTKLKADGTTILLSAHQMDLVERIADRVLLMNRGREILSGSLAELHGRLDPRNRLRVSLEGGTGAHGFDSDPDVESVEADGEGFLVTLRDGAAIPAFVARAVARAPVRSLAAEQSRLHDVFLRAVREDDLRADGRRA